MQSWSRSKPWPRAVRAGVIALSVAGSASPAQAEVKEVFLGQQFGAVYMPMMVMEDQKLVEKHLAAAGMADVKVTWAKMGGPSALVDAFISGNLHFAAQGTPSLGLLWDRTKGGLNVRALGSVSNNNIWLNTKNPNIKTLEGFHREGPDRHPFAARSRRKPSSCNTLPSRPGARASTASSIRSSFRCRIPIPWRPS